jgi:hypothetical protein
VCQVGRVRRPLLVLWLEGVRRVKVAERLQPVEEGAAAGFMVPDEPAQRRAEPQHLTGPVAAQTLMRPRHELERVEPAANGRQRRGAAAIEPDDLGEQVRIRGMRRRAGGGLPFPAPGTERQVRLAVRSARGPHLRPHRRVRLRRAPGSARRPLPGPASPLSSWMTRHASMATASRTKAASRPGKRPPKQGRHKPGWRKHFAGPCRRCDPDAL